MFIVNCKVIIDGRALDANRRQRVTIHPDLSS